MKRITFAALVLLMSGFLLTACNKENPVGTETPDDQSAVSLEKEFGGYTTSDEAPMFNDQEVIAESLEDVSANDAMSAQDLPLLNAASGVKAYAVRVTWGLLPGDSTATEVVDWSGKIAVNKGVLTVLRTISFERNQGDKLVLPRTSRKEVSFNSQTRPYIDGLLLIIIDKDTSNTDGELSLTLGGNYTRTLRFSELDSAEIVEPVGANGHAVSIITHSKQVREFNGGFLAGRWVRKNEKGGEFFGKWINSEGTNAGSVKGIWGTRNNGEHVFFGKYITGNGQFNGLLRGKWGYNGERNGGTFEGQWVNRQLQESGKLQGHFRLGRPNDGKGFFHGRWSKNS